ncbi:addiction module component [Zobellella maritima]|uniref:addiction module component n=1 Tax=Zobellella maritima TaxID=2059725 RepID=UPI000E30133A|nr:addiction module component [Zobellella maritima]
MKSALTLLLAAGLLAGCANERHYDFAMGESVDEINELQIMDPDAPARNDGKIAALTLNGNYGVPLYGTYVKGAEAPAEGKTQVTLNFGN